MSMTMAEKILARASHQEKVSPNEYVTAFLDKVVTHEGMALVAGKLKALGVEKLWDPERIIIALDHYVPAPTPRAAKMHQIVREAVKKYNISNYYGITGGVAHQVMVEKGHVLPGELIVGTDSHTCTYGALGAGGCGIGVSEMAYVMATGELWFRVPETIRFLLNGKLGDLVTSKDVMLRILGEFSSDFAQYKSIEFFGPVASAMSISSRMTMSNMAVEMGAKFGLFKPDDKTVAYLSKITGAVPDIRMFDDLGEPAAQYEIDLSDLEPMVAMPHAVDNIRPVSEIKDVEIHQAFLGSCTNGRLEDLHMAARLASGRKVHPYTRLLIAPASREIYLEAMKDGTLETLIEVGGVVLNPGCGACFGGHMGLLAEKENCIASSNRNFKGRMGNDQANIYLGSPATVMASAICGRIADPREL